jgi:hypothetical protein
VGVKTRKNHWKWENLFSSESARDMQRCHYFVMRGEIDGQLVKIAGLNGVKGEMTGTPMRRDVVAICLII